MKNVEKQYTFAEDPGHGWLVVPLADVEAVGAVHNISQHSYVKRNEHGEMCLWLEEDCDAPMFVHCAAKIGWGIHWKREHTNSSHPIRNHTRYSYDRYCKGWYK